MEVPKGEEGVTLDVETDRLTLANVRQPPPRTPRRCRSFAAAPPAATAVAVAGASSGPETRAASPQVALGAAAKDGERVTVYVATDDGGKYAIGSLTKARKPRRRLPAERRRGEGSGVTSPGSHPELPAPGQPARRPPRRPRRAVRRAGPASWLPAAGCRRGRGCGRLSPEPPLRAPSPHPPSGPPARRPPLTAHLAPRRAPPTSSLSARGSSSRTAPRRGCLGGARAALPRALAPANRPPPPPSPAAAHVLPHRGLPRVSHRPRERGGAAVPVR